jgi:hypothetical protein
MACALGVSGKATLEQRHTTQDPLPTAVDVPAVAQILTGHGVRCDDIKVFGPSPMLSSKEADVATHWSCTTGNGELQIAIYPPGSPVPAPNGPRCSPGLTKADGVKFVFEARGGNFTVVADPTANTVKSLGAPDIWVVISDATTKVGQAAGLDLMEFTFHCK